MTGLAPDLFDTDFDRLRRGGRALIPQFAPDWTDHNIHDPGIMLIELLAWVAEAQIYSLARQRTDERRAYAALFGVDEARATSATGVLWPFAVDVPAAGQLVAAGTVATPRQANPPPFVVAQSVRLTGAVLTRLETIARDRGIVDHEAAWRRGEADFLPLGADGAGRLRLTTCGTLVPADGGEVPLSIGVQVREDRSVPAGAAPALRMWLAQGDREVPLAIVDGTAGLTRSGAILVRLPAGPIENAVLLLSGPGGPLPDSPRIADVVLGVLPVVQRSLLVAHAPALDEPVPDRLLPFHGDPDDAVLTDPVVTVDGEKWRRVDAQGAAGPDDRVYLFDAATRSIRFGNGVNGKIARGAVNARLEVTRGEGGNVTAGLEWQVAGSGLWRNRTTTNGGGDALDLAGMQHLARDRMRSDHALVTAGDLITAALAFDDLEVARAEVTALSDGGLRMIVVRSRDVGAAPNERAAWLAELARRLRPRLLLGQRLEVWAPTYAALTIRASVQALPGADLPAIERTGRDTLLSLLDPVPRAGRGGWPLGMAVSEADLRARLRAIENVAHVLDCRTDGQERLGATGLPILTHDTLHLSIRRAGEGRG